ncbi:hypothetical protein M885DRAFT_625018 [Pelagophyceae sp. CCMP2097]|nr:hypothetical protein M885DRAFT_625018 [Pelagophyceae sp. CCMP2097]
MAVDVEYVSDAESGASDSECAASESFVVVPAAGASETRDDDAVAPAHSERDVAAASRAALLLGRWLRRNDAVDQQIVLTAERDRLRRSVADDLVCEHFELVHDHFVREEFKNDGRRAAPAEGAAIGTQSAAVAVLTATLAVGAAVGLFIMTQRSSPATTRAWALGAAALVAVGGALAATAPARRSEDF